MPFIAAVNLFCRDVCREPEQHLLFWSPRMSSEVFRVVTPPLSARSLWLTSFSLMNSWSPLTATNRFFQISLKIPFPQNFRIQPTLSGWVFCGAESGGPWDGKHVGPFKQETRFGLLRFFFTVSGVQNKNLGSAFYFPNKTSWVIVKTSSGSNSRPVWN